MCAPLQGPVLYWTAFPATNTGTEAKHVPGHILFPPGVAWAPFPKTPKPVIHPGETPSPGLPIKPENDAVVVFGSKTVTVMGSNAVRLGDIALSCSEPPPPPARLLHAEPKTLPSNSREGIRHMRTKVGKHQLTLGWDGEQLAEAWVGEFEP
ncbi:hypothetical protein G6O69_20760 [Pseudenhygromyxa sp. WMMC2535]|uniref:hypothetical protein n=1 Tax=Pseudenhygromyxa sp. WMMC2535 TaxID=2712867 RepID=UPI0015557FD6|nr:hypothetical protein [Pseudenhygromyxa sp. WMMC2535]NVB40286.1 hypothetical protein [Pseudenhygromyxa sp. WMMC2535]